MRPSDPQIPVTHVRPVAPQQPATPAARPWTANQILWLVCAILTGLLGLAGAAHAAEGRPAALVCVILLVTGYVFCRALERILP